MKRFQMVLVSVAVLGIAAPVFAQRVEVQPIQVRPGLQTEAPLLSAEAVEKLKLTVDQNEKYTKLEAEYKDKAKAALEGFRAAVQGVRDREKYKEAQEKLAQDSKKAREDSLAKVEPILNADQKTVFAQVRNQQPQPGGVRVQPTVGPGIGQILPPALQNRLQLTDEQKKQIEAIQKEAEAKLLKVLNDDQKAQLEKMKKGILIRPKQVDPAQPNPRIQPANPQIAPLPAKRD